MDHTEKIVLYTSNDGVIQLEVQHEGETLWLNRQQLAQLFDRDVKTIGKHIDNALSEELEGIEGTVAKFATVQLEGSRWVTRQVEHYNLEVITSVGYRVKSRRGVEFRRWANRILRDFLLKGYALSHRLNSTHYEELQGLLAVLRRTINDLPDLSRDDTHALIEMVASYSQALDTLDDYDYQRLSVEDVTEGEAFRATYENALEAIALLKPRFGGSSLFGNEKDSSFRSTMGQLYQTFDGVELYPSIEEKAAILLYLVVKNHSFSDGNKRIAAMLFLWFLYRNGVLYRPDGSKRIADNALVAITLLIAESRTEEKDVMLRVLVNLINQKN